MTKKQHAALRKKWGFKLPWIGVDLDATLAHSHSWAGYDVIGEPIPSMLKRVKRWLREGKTVKIFSSRAEVGEMGIKPIQDWCERYGLGRLEVTNIKDSGLVELWDDLAIKVGENTGKVCCGYKKNWKTRIVYG